MATHYDTISFELFDAYAGGERWAEEYEAPLLTVKIFINGQELNALFVAFEDHYENLEHDNPNEVYGHLEPFFLLRCLTSEYAETYGASLNCCSDCACEGCWEVRVHISETDDEVIWHDFEHEHRHYPYNWQFRFKKEEYEKQIKLLESWADK